MPAQACCLPPSRSSPTPQPFPLSGEDRLHHGRLQFCRRSAEIQRAGPRSPSALIARVELTCPGRRARGPPRHTRVCAAPRPNASNMKETVVQSSVPGVCSTAWKQFGNGDVKARCNQPSTTSGRAGHRSPQKQQHYGSTPTGHTWGDPWGPSVRTSSLQKPHVPSGRCDEERPWDSVHTKQGPERWVSGD